MRNRYLTLAALILSVAIFLLASCGYRRNEIILATTTSTYDTGLLDRIIPVFENETGYMVKPIAVGTGEALSMGRMGAADILFLHSKDSEEEFVRQGYGTQRRDVMYNDFIIVGPGTDSANIEGGQADAAFSAVFANQELFISRGDNSGTHMMEMSIWEKAGVEPEGIWYLETGQGAADTLMIADQKQAYTIIDRATYLVYSADLSLVVLVEGDPMLFNPYGVVIVNPEKFEDIEINHQGALAFADFLTGQGREIIKGFGMERFARPLFYMEEG